MPNAAISAEDALRERRELREGAGDLDVLRDDVGERVAIRNPPGEWLIARYDSAVRLFLRCGDAYVSRYVWRVRHTDATIDHLIRVGGADV